MNRAAARVPGWFALPVIAWLLLFVGAPLVIVAVYSFGQRGTYGGVQLGVSVANYLRAVEWIYFRIFWSSVKLALLTAGSCLVLGFPLAWLMVTAKQRYRPVLFALVVIPFWTNFVVRAYAIRALLSENGWLAGVIGSLGWDTSGFGPGPVPVWLGMVGNYLPFMILPLYVSLGKLDLALLEAGRDLGARPFQVFFKILLPLCRGGILSGLLFVFIPALGEFVIPDMLGGARAMLIGNLITDQFLRARNWPFGSALALLLITGVLLSMAIFSRLGRKRELA